MSAPSSSETEASPAPPKQEQDIIADPGSGRSETLVPLETPVPTKPGSEPQQGDTGTGDGGKSHVSSSPVINSDSQPSDDPTQDKIPWKDQVLGFAKVTRGKMLGKRDTTEAGQKILQGEILPQETRKAST